MIGRTLVYDWLCAGIDDRSDDWFLISPRHIMIVSSFRHSTQKTEAAKSRFGLLLVIQLEIEQSFQYPV